MKYPGRLVDEDNPKTFGIVGFKAFDHKLNGPIVLIT